MSTHPRLDHLLERVVWWEALLLVTAAIWLACRREQDASPRGWDGTVEWWVR